MKWWPWLYPKLIGDWPKGRSLLGRRTAVFNRPRAPLRPMIVMVDSALLETAKQDPKVGYLLELLTDQYIQSHLYSQGGPPRYAQNVIATDSGIEGFKDWVTTVVAEDENVDAVFLKDGVPVRVRTEAKDRFFLHLSRSSSPSEKPGQDIGQQKIEDAYALIVAKAIRADIVITDHPLKVDLEMDFWRGTSVMSPHVALPIIGLYLRQQEEYIFHRSPALGMPISQINEVRRDRTWFYWQASQTLIPGRYRWASACEMYSSSSGDLTLSSLPKALTWRLNQVLRARDRLLATLALVPQDHAPVDDVVTELDQILLWLMAVLDITAQVVHVALEIPMKLRSAAWQFDEWVNKVAKFDPALAQKVRGGNEGQHVLTIVRTLRNSVHGDALSANGIIPIVGDHALNMLVALPESGREQVLEAVDALGGKEAWGIVQPFPEHELHLHAGVFVEQLLPRFLKVVNELMEATPVEQLLEVGIPSERLPGPYPRTLQEHRILWQLGLDLDISSDPN